MGDSADTFVGLDVGDSLALLAWWAGPREASWPARARVQALRVTATPGPDEFQRLIRELCAQCGGRPEDCFLVSMGTTNAACAAETAASLGMRGVIEPPRRFVLWSEGVLPATEVKEYARPAPNADTLDLGLLRACFADLMEEAAQDVQARAMDQDDTLLDRFVDARYRGTTDVLTVPVESLTDHARLLGPFHAAYAARFGEAREDAAVEITTARLRCIILT